MTSTSTSESPLIDNTWLNQDCGQRIITLEKLDPNTPESAAFFSKIAVEDEHEAVRCCAVARITDLDTLQNLQEADGKVREAAQQQQYRIVAGIVDSNHSEADRIGRLKILPTNGIKQVALITKLKSIASTSINAVEQNEDLADLCLFASNVYVRKSAAEKIDDTHLLRDILSRVEGKDKTVSRTIKARLESITPVRTENTADIEDKADVSGEEKPSATAITARDSETDKPPKVESSSNKPTAKEVVTIEPRLEFDTVEEEAKKLSFKNTARLFEIRSQLRKLKARLDDSERDLLGQIETLHAEIESKIGKNNEYQEKLKEKTEELLSSLAEALESGSSEIATQCWDKIQGNISNTANQIRAELQKKANAHKEKITELRDWKIFAATEKKKELITQMQHLLDSKMHASDRSKNISNMHKEWKDLGRSNQNEQLWKQFKTLSDKAYEPCKEYFKQRKQLMAENLVKRRAICDSLEAQLKEHLDSDEDADISKLNKLLNAAEKDWKSHAPIEQNKIKSLQKRFYGTVNQLRKLRKSHLSENAKQKQELISQAQALTTHEDNKHAMNEAKRLQQEWKKVGPTSYREDNKFWQDFRSACDTIFGKRDQAASAHREELLKIETRLKQILAELAAIASKSDSEFRDSRAAYQDLAQEFSNSLDPRLKANRKRLLDQFNASKRQIDSRFRALPDKRQQLIQQSILAKADLLTNLELNLLTESDPDKFSALQSGFDSEAFNANAKSGNAEVDAMLQTRLDSALSAKSSSDMSLQCERAEERFRQLCVLAEIRANVDSPVEDRPLRMKLQLEQLQSGFGQAKPDPKQNLKYAMQADLESMGMGPLQDSVRKNLSDRLVSVLQKLR